jgi:hypothetical protein
MVSYGFRVYGIPKPQGSKIPGVSSKTGKMFVREQSGKGLTDWREDVKQAALSARGVPGHTSDIVDVPVATLLGPINLKIQFFLLRPASVKMSKRPLPTVAPDLDKLIRGTGDALKVAGAYNDDAQVVAIQATKVYVTDSPGAWIVISEIPTETLSL